MHNINARGRPAFIYVCAIKFVQVARAQTLLKVVGEPLSSASIRWVYACVCFDLIGHTAPISYEYDDGGWVGG